MHTEHIAQADQTLSASRRICAESVELRVQTIALLFRYRTHRFPHVSGGSDTTDCAATIRTKIAAGVLPRPTESPEKCWGGKGTMRLCHGCAVAIAPQEVEYELDIVGGPTLLFCATCLTAWNAFRAERMPA